MINDMRLLSGEKGVKSMTARERQRNTIHNKFLYQRDNSINGNPTLNL
jgi:hypothetical protein